MQHTVLIEDLAVVLCVAGLVTILFQKIKQPIVLGYLIAGIIIGPYTPPFSFIDDEVEIRLLAELGVIFLMFSLGLEFTFGKLSRLGLPALIIALFEVVAMLLIGFFTGEMLGWSIYNSLLLGAALSISSTTIIIKALEDLKLKKFSFADLMIGVLLIEDILAILLLVFISTTNINNPIFSYQLLFSSLKLLLVISSWFLIGYFIIPYMMRKIQHYINHETLTIISVGLCLFLSSLAIYYNYSAALGAFIMGAILAETPLVQKIETLTLPIRDIFGAVFFVSVGMLIDPKVLVNYWHWILLLSATTIIGKILTSGFGSLLAGQSLADSIRIGFSMAQIGEFSFIIIGIGSTMKTMDSSIYPIIVAISAITTFTTPYLMKFGMKVSDKIEISTPLGWRNKLRMYRDWFNRPIVEKANKKIEIHIIRFVINSIIIAIIAVVCADVIIPRLLPSVNKTWIYQLLIWLTMFLIFSPFIWAMLFAYQPIKSKRITLFAWLGMLTELCLIVYFYFKFPLLIIPIAIILILCFLLFYKTIKKVYVVLENNLIYNLTRKYEIDPTILQQLAPWDNELVKIKVSNLFPFIGQSLEESKLRPSFGINIVAIKRGFKTIWIPNAKERILPEDELVILGEKEQVDNFSEFAHRVGNEEKSIEQPELLIQSMQIHEQHILINRPIFDPIVKQQINGLIVGLDRGGQHILNPEPSTILQDGDILLFISKKENEAL